MLGLAVGLESLVAVVNKMFKLLKMKRSTLLHFYGAMGTKGKEAQLETSALLVYFYREKGYREKENGAASRPQVLSSEEGFF